MSPLDLQSVMSDLKKIGDTTPDSQTGRAETDLEIILKRMLISDR